MELIIELIVCIILFIVISGLIMVATNILYDLSAAIIPIIAVLMICVGIVVGLVSAVKNTVGVYKQVYFMKGR